MSVVAIWGRCFETSGRTFGHVMDPRTGQPTESAWLTAVILPCATETDALSTALLTLGPSGQDRIAQLRTGLRSLVVTGEQGVIRAFPRNFA